MKRIFKTTMLAAAVATMCGTAVAGTVSVTKQVHSSEGLEGVTANQTSNAISYTVNAAYRDGDKVTFTFTDGALVANGFPSQLNVPAVNSDDVTKSIAGMALGLLNSSDNSVTYRVTSVTQPTNIAGTTTYSDRTTLGNTIPLTTVSYKAAAVRAGAVTVTVNSQTTAGDVLDNDGTRTATIAEAKSQFGTAAVGTKFDATIDVAQMRKAFTSGTNDQMAWTISNPTTTGWLNMATVNATNGTLITLQGEAGNMTDLKSSAWSTGKNSTNTFTVAESKLAMSYGGMVTNDTVTFTPPTGTDAVVLEQQKFTTKFEVNYTSAGAQAGSKLIAGAVDSGEWDLNGATVNIPYMPYGPNASQIVYVSNAGDQEGDISVTVFDDKGSFYDLGIIGKSPAKRVAKIAPLINAKLQDAGFSGTKASITITVNAPESDITVFSSYNVGGADRGFVNTDQYKGK